MDRPKFQSHAIDLLHEKRGRDDGKNGRANSGSSIQRARGGRSSRRATVSIPAAIAAATVGVAECSALTPKLHGLPGGGVGLAAAALA